MDITSKIITAPQIFSLTGQGSALLGRAGDPYFRIENRSLSTLASAAEAKLRSKLYALLGSSEEGNDILITLTDGKAPENTPNADQGYSLTVTPHSITLCGFGDRGLLYAAVTLCQMLSLENGKVSLPSLEITDWPDLEKRGHFIESRFGTNLMTFDDWKSVVDDLVEKKQNTLSVSVYGCWSIQFDGIVSEYLYVPLAKYPKLVTPVYTKYYSPEKKAWIDEKQLPPMYEEDFFGDLIAYGKSVGVEVFPFFNTYGHNTLVPAMYPEVSAKYEDGSPTDNGLCTRNPATDEMLFDILDTIIEKYLQPYGITSFDIGLDEVGDADYTTGVNAVDPFKNRPAFCQCEKCRDASAIERFVEHAVKIIGHLKEKGMKSVYLYNDMLYRAYRPKEQDFLPMFVEAIEKAGLSDVTVIDWWKYNCDKKLFDSLAFNADDLARSRMHSVVKPMNGYYHWHLLHPAIKNSYNHALVANESKCCGLISYSGWDNMFDRVNSAQAMMSWSFEKRGTPEQCTRAYAEKLFPSAAEKAIRGFELLDLINEESDEKRADGSTILSTRKLFEGILSYYSYSYLRAGKPYPRNFPGEALQTISANRAETEALIRLALAGAKEASSIFTELSETAGCNRFYAQLYALESNNYALLCEDYLALLRMSDLNAEGIDSDSASEIAALAESRRDARLAHMAKLEKLKAHYLLSSQMRHQSIFMQLFADIAAHINTTPVYELKLDFNDLSPIGSAQFFRIR